MLFIPFNYADYNLTFYIFKFYMLYYIYCLVFYYYINILSNYAIFSQFIALNIFKLFYLEPFYSFYIPLHAKIYIG